MGLGMAEEPWTPESLSSGPRLLGTGLHPQECNDWPSSQPNHGAGGVSAFAWAGSLTLFQAPPSPAAAYPSPSPPRSHPFLSLC